MLISFTADPTKPSELQEVIDAAASMLSTGDSTSDSTEHSGVEAALSNLLARIGKNGTRALRADAEMSKQGDGYHNLKAMAKHLGVSLETARSYRANLQRSRKQMEREVPGAPQEFYDSKPGDEGSLYKMRPEIAELVLKLT